jgi:hypothetical protein
MSQNPIPVRFPADEQAALDEVARRAGLNRGDVIRRACRLLFKTVAKEGNLNFLMDLVPLGERYPDGMSSPYLMNEDPISAKPSVRRTKK